MSKMLMISYYAPPILNAESILVAKTLKFLSKEYQIDLLTVGEETDFKQDPFLLEEMGGEVNVIRAANPKPSSRLMRKIYREAVARLSALDNPIWQRRAERAAIDLGGDYDVLYSRSQPGASHVVALRVKERYGTPWVAQFSDPWGHNPYHQLQGKAKRAVERLEQQVIERADHLIFPTLEMRDLYASVYRGADVENRSTVLPHHFDAALYQGGAAKKRDRKIVMSYIGDFYGLRSPAPLIKGLTFLKEKRPDLVERLELQVVGNVERTFHPLLEAAEKTLGVQVTRVGQVPFRKSLELMAESDLLLLVDAPSDVNLFLSSKLIDYLGAYRPILGITSTKGTAGRLLQSYGWQVHHPDDVQGIANALETYLSQLAQLQERARNTDIDAFRSESVVSELTAICERVRHR
ncbi:glycosyltransferase [Tumebacillus lipolyticus]|uniref:Glycosyltransferase n=1 Tax=Tumebacillus lipolyticus TaxID=1280370 RepID=A0ABW4ZS54_9BACL